MSQFILIILLTLIATSCKVKSYIREYKPEFNSTSMAKIPKIALIGFNPYFTTSTTVGKTITTTAKPNHLRSMKSIFEIGKDIRTFPVNGIREDLEEKDIKSFAKTLINTGELGLAVESQKTEDNQRKYKLKKIDCDFYLVAVFMPGFTNVKSGLTLSSYLFLGIPSVVTLGTIPFFTGNHTESFFFLYDRNLKLIRVFSYKNYYSTMEAWWTTNYPEEDTERFHTPRAPTYITYKPDIEQAQDDIIRFLSSKK